MFEIIGRYTTAKVFAEQVDETCIKQITEMCNHEAFTNPIAITTFKQLINECHFISRVS